MIIRYFHKFFISSLLIFSFNQAIAEQLDNFSSDGCSQFPDGTLMQENLWCDCCIAHDITYWQGGSQEQKEQADRVLQSCVLQKTDNKLLAGTMYYGVVLGGSPVFPTGYRWGYGWQYGRGYQSLSFLEKQQVKDKLQNYWMSIPQTQAFCDFEHPLNKGVKSRLKKLLSYLQGIKQQISLLH